MTDAARPRVLMVLGYSPQFGRAFAKAASLVADVVSLREVSELSGSPTPGMRHLHQVSEKEYELQIPKRSPTAFWHNPWFPVYGNRFNKTLRYLERAHGDIDLIHGHFYSSVINALRSSKPVLVSEHSNIFGRPSSPQVERSIRLARDTYERVTLGLPVSRHQERLMRNSRVDTAMEVIYNPVDPLDFPFSERQAPSRTVRLLTACRLAPTKNLVVAADAIRLLTNDMMIRWTVLGEGIESAHLKRSIKTMGMGGIVSIRGRAQPKQVSAAMQNSHIYLMSSTVESFGLPVVEALVSGLPVVATPVGIAPEIADITSLTLSGGFESTEIADGIQKLIDDFPTGDDQASGSRAARALFSPNQIGVALGNTYASLM